MRALVEASVSVYRTDSIRPVLMVRWPDGSGWVVKQPGETRAQAVAALQREAAIYELAESAFSDRLLRHLPRMAEYDGAVHALVLERVGHLNAWAAMLGQAGPVEGLAAPVAAAYRALHEEPVPLDHGGSVVPDRLPWILDPVETAGDAFDYIRAEEGMAEALAALGTGWTRSCLINGDAKLENVVLDPAGRHAWLIDWTSVAVGDPAWDLAGIVQSALTLWLSGLELDAAGGVGAAVARGSFSGDEIDGFIRTFLSAYGATDRALLARVFRMTGARLLQTVFEHSRKDAARMPRHVAMLQLAKAALADPDAMFPAYAP